MIFYTYDRLLERYNGTEVEVIRSLTLEECDIEDVGNIFVVRFYDGYESDVFADELIGGF